MELKSCCGKTKIGFKLHFTLSADILPLLVGAGYREAKNFTKAGMLYVENDAIVANGPFGSNVIHIICKINDCSPAIDNFEKLLQSSE